MFQLDDNFLNDLGLNELPEAERKAFLVHIYSELELRVGVKLSEGLSEAQLGEFESFVDRKEDKVRAWVEANAPDYKNDPAYIQLKEGSADGADDAILLAEYASLKWLGINRPNYREVVSKVLEELKAEIKENRSTILGNTQTA